MSEDQIYAKVIADSVSPDGVRLTTIEGRLHRFVLAEMNTHRVISKNSASSRAIPFVKQVARVEKSPAVPVVFPAEQKGMQGGDEVSYPETALEHWLGGSEDAITTARNLASENVHKSIVNRVLEPYQMHTIVCTATSWQNFFDQRCHPDAQPEIRVFAEAVQAAMAESTPKRLVEGEWHLPYIDAEDWEAVRQEKIQDVRNLGRSMYPEMVKISAARCARTSYETQDGKRDFHQDLALYDRLTNRQQDAAFAHSPIHWSPLEHVATPWPSNRQSIGIDFRGFDGKWHDVPTSHLPLVGNLLGWRSLRTEVETITGSVTHR